MSKKRLNAKVISAKMDKTVVVAVEMPRRHSLYGKIIKNTRRFKARDDIGVAEGTTVIIEECVPFSKTVSWKVVEKVDLKKETKK